MKRTFFYLVLATMTVAGLWTACGSDDDDSTGDVSKKEVKYADEAMGIDIGAGKLIHGNDEISRIELTEAGDAVITAKELVMPDGVKTRSSLEGVLKYMHGTFVFDGKKYSVNIDGRHFCDITVSSKSGSNIYIDVTFADNTAVSVEATLLPKLVDSATKSMCATWKIVHTRLRLQGEVTGAADFDQCDLHEILEYVKSRGGNISQEFDINKVVTDIKLTAWGTFEIKYKDGTQDIGTWKWSNGSGKFTYTWNGKDMGNDFENGNATFDQRPYKNKTYDCLTLGADVKYEGKNYNASITLFLE